MVEAREIMSLFRIDYPTLYTRILVVVVVVVVVVGVVNNKEGGRFRRDKHKEKNIIALLFHLMRG